MINEESIQKFRSVCDNIFTQIRRDVIGQDEVVDLAKHRPRDAVSLRDQSLSLRITALGFMVEQAGRREFGFKVEHRVV